MPGIRSLALGTILESPSPLLAASHPPSLECGGYWGLILPLLLFFCVVPLKPIHPPNLEDTLMPGFPPSLILPALSPPGCAFRVPVV